MSNFEGGSQGTPDQWPTTQQAWPSQQQGSQQQNGQQYRGQQYGDQQYGDQQFGGQQYGGQQYGGQQGWAPEQPGAQSWNAQAWQEGGGNNGYGAPPPPRRSGGSKLIVPIVVLALAVLVVVSVGFFVWHSSRGSSDAASQSISPQPVQQQTTQTDQGSSPAGDANGSGAVAQPPATVTVTPSSSDTSSTDPEVQALTDLNSQRSTDLPLNFDGTWAAQVASQPVGATDTKLQPTPLTAVDIWNRSQALRSQFGSTYSVKLVKQGDFGRVSSDPRTIWITLVLLEASSKADAQNWCDTTYGSTGDVSEYCVPRQIVALHN